MCRKTGPDQQTKRSTMCIQRESVARQANQLQARIAIATHWGRSVWGLILCEFDSRRQPSFSCDNVTNHRVAAGDLEFRKRPARDSGAFVCYAAVWTSIGRRLTAVAIGKWQPLLQCIVYRIGFNLAVILDVHMEFSCRVVWVN